MSVSWRSSSARPLLYRLLLAAALMVLFAELARAGGPKYIAGVG